MKTRPFAEIDVFSNGAFSGNPLAVVLDGSDLSTAQMQMFANWTNFSETTFVLPPTHAQADYAVRIFTPTLELPFAGHPTLGTCFALLRSAVKPKTPGVMTQECAAGLIHIKITDEKLAFAAPPLRRDDVLPAPQIDALAKGLGLSPSDVVRGQWCDNGPAWRGLLLHSHAALMKAKPDVALLRQAIANEASASMPKLGLIAPAPILPDLGLIAATPLHSGVDFEVRAFFPGGNSYFEDPVTGSLNAGLAQWLIGCRIAKPSYVVAQGSALGRNGRVYVTSDENHIWIGGNCTAAVSGTVVL
jgi:PhzF family phenazine biosynthesis protein